MSLNLDRSLSLSKRLVSVAVQLGLFDASTGSATIAAFCFDRLSSRRPSYLSSLYSRYQVQRDQMPLSRYRALTIGMKTRPALR